MQQSPTYPQQQNVPTGKETIRQQQQGMARESVYAEQGGAPIAGIKWNSVWTGTIFAIATFALLTSLLQGFSLVVSGTPATLTSGGIWVEMVAIVISYFVGGLLCGRTIPMNLVGNLALYGSAVWALFTTALVTIIVAGAHALFMGHAMGNASLNEISWVFLTTLVIGYILCVAGALASGRMVPSAPNRRP